MAHSADLFSPVYTQLTAAGKGKKSAWQEQVVTDLGSGPGPECLRENIAACSGDHVR